MTKTRELHIAQQELRRRMVQEITETARAEFPAGTKVRWVRTYKAGQPMYCEGVVKTVGNYRMTVQTKSGATHDIDFQAAEFLTANA